MFEVNIILFTFSAKCHSSVIILETKEAVAENFTATASLIGGCRIVVLLYVIFSQVINTRWNCLV